MDAAPDKERIEAAQVRRASIIAVLRRENPAAPDHDIVIYADGFLDYQEAAENVRRNGVIVAHPRTGAPIPNPYADVKAAAAATIRKIRLRTGPLWDVPGPPPLTGGHLLAIRAAMTECCCTRWVLCVLPGHAALDGPVPDGVSAGAALADQSLLTPLLRDAGPGAQVVLLGEAGGEMSAYWSAVLET